MRPLEEDGGVRLLLDGARGESHEDLCALCEEAGELICCEGRCQRVFHRACIPPTNPPPDAEGDEGETSAKWICSDCRVKRYRCFVCKAWGADRWEVHACGRKGCAKSYHVECLMATLQVREAPP